MAPAGRGRQKWLRPLRRLCTVTASRPPSKATALRARAFSHGHCQVDSISLVAEPSSSPGAAGRTCSSGKQDLIHERVHPRVAQATAHAQAGYALIVTHHALIFGICMHQLRAGL